MLLYTKADSGCLPAANVNKTAPVIRPAQKCILIKSAYLRGEVEGNGQD
jgi:hypothetical protein